MTIEGGRLRFERRGRVIAGGNLNGLCHKKPILAIVCDACISTLYTHIKLLVTISLRQ